MHHSFVRVSSHVLRTFGLAVRDKLLLQGDLYTLDNQFVLSRVYPFLQYGIRLAWLF